MVPKISIVLFLAVFLLFGCTQQPPTQTGGGGTVPPAGDAASVEIKGMAFAPAELTISRGTTVTWVNNDSVAHTVTSTGNFDSGKLQPGEKYSFTFDTAGSFGYICTIHTFMKAKITVQ